MRKASACFLLGLALFGMAACWDRVDIQNRALVLAAGVDLVPAGTLGSEGAPRYGITPGDQYNLIVKVPVFEQAQAPESGRTKATEKMIDSVAPTLFEANQQMALKIPRELFYSHLQAVVISKDAGRHNLRAATDFLERDPEMNRNMVILFTPGKAAEILAFTPQIESSVGSFLKQTAQNQAKTSRTIGSDMNTFLVDYHNTGNALAARVVKVQEELKLSGSAVIVGGSLAGWLDEIETRSAQFLRGEVKGGAFTIDDPRVPGEYVTVEIKKSSVKTQAKLEEGKVSIKSDITIIGDIVDVTAYSEKINTQYVRKIETAGAASIRKEIEATVRRFQEDFKADVFRFGAKMRSTYKNWWQQNEERWDEVFSKAEVEITVDLKIRRTGNIR